MPVIIVGGRGVSIAHLAPATILCPSDQLGRDLVIAVAYSNHCYTRGFDAALHAKADILVREHKKVGRVFDQTRYDLSLDLPTIMAAMPGTKVHQTPERRNYVYSTVVPLPSSAASPGAPSSYQVFFAIRRAPVASGFDLHVTVESAYPLDGPPVVTKRPAAIRFALLASKVYAGQAIKFAVR